MTNIYLYDEVLNIDFNISNVINDHCNKYKIAESRNMSFSNYYHLMQKLNQLNIDINNLYFDDKGKPKINNIYISMAHSKSLYGFVISDSNIGIDIEQIITKNIDSVAKRILTNKEYLAYLECDDKKTFITNKWTLKEAYSKYIGTGITKDVFNTDVEGLSFNILNNIVSIYNAEDVVIYLNDNKLE